MMYASRAPRWIQALGLRAMPLGLDLRGGLYLLYQVDVDGAVEQLLTTYDQDFRRALNTEKIPFTDITSLQEDSDIPNGLRVLLPAGADLGAVRAAIKKAQPDLGCRDAVVAEGAAVDCVMTKQQVRERRNFAITSNITTLRNRVNALGVSEPIVQQQGPDRINVQLPGVQNSAEVKSTLGKVATLEYRLEDPRPMPANGRAPPGAKIYKHKDGRHVMLKREIIATGDQMINATSSSGPAGSGGQTSRSTARAANRCSRSRKANLGKRMGVVFIEHRREVVEVDGKQVERDVKEETVISLATLQGVFSNRFRDHRAVDERSERAGVAVAWWRTGGADLDCQ